MFFRRQKTAGNDNALGEAGQDRPAATVVGAGAVIQGNIETAGDLRIDGTVQGSVRASQVTIGPDGAVEGGVQAEDVLVQGFVKGPVHARHIHLESRSAVEGDLTTATIAIDLGARLSGAVWQDQAAAAAEDGAEASGAGTAASPSPSIWDTPADDAFRPLAAIRPRTGSDGR